VLMSVKESLGLSVLSWSFNIFNEGWLAFLLRQFAVVYKKELDVLLNFFSWDYIVSISCEFYTFGWPY
jgi:hypothetical protein